jgi:hypothetical protein
MPITASARTNAIGMGDDQVLRLEGLGVKSAHTDAFKLEVSGKGGAWRNEDEFRPIAEKWYLQLKERGGASLGDLLSRDGEWGIIGLYMKNSGIALGCKVKCMFYKPEGKRVEREVWIQRFRYKAMLKRVYGHARKPKTKARA